MVPTRAPSLCRGRCPKTKRKSFGATPTRRYARIRPTRRRLGNHSRTRTDCRRTPSAQSSLRLTRRTATKQSFCFISNSPVSLTSKYSIFKTLPSKRERRYSPASTSLYPCIPARRRTPPQDSRSPCARTRTSKGSPALYGQTAEARSSRFPLDFFTSRISPCVNTTP